MKTWYFIFVFCVSCNPNHENTSNDLISALPNVTDSTTREYGNLREITKVIDCGIDQKKFQNEMGIGLMLFDELPITLFSSLDSIESDSLVIQNNTVYYSKINVAGKEKDYLELFTYQTDYEPNGIIWKSGKGKNSPKEIIVNKFDKPYWLPIEEAKKHLFYTWEDYLKGQHVSVQSRNTQNNPIVSKPSENAELVELPKNSKGMIYIIESVKENWVLLKSGAEDQSNLQLKEGTEIGWMKWYCGDSMRIDILDNYGLEDYFYED